MSHFRHSRLTRSEEWIFGVAGAGGLSGWDGDGAAELVARPCFIASRTARLHHLAQLHDAAADREPEGREHEAVEQPGPRRFPGRLTRRVRSEVRRAESGESGPPIAPEPRKRAFRASESGRRRGIAHP